MQTSYPYLLPDFDMVKIEVPGDGNCFFHSVMLGCVKSYIDRPQDRICMANALRRELAQYLVSRLPNGEIVYDTLSRGELREYAKVVPEYSMENMVALLLSRACVGLEVLEITCNLLDVNIILWNHVQKDIYRHGDKELLFRPERSTVVVLYEPGHYSLLGLRLEGQVYTHFSHTNALVRHLNSLW